MKPITPAQLKIIHVLLNDLGIMPRKRDLIYSFTDGRTDSCRDMYLSEAKTLIEYLKGRDEYTNLLNRIWHLAYEAGIIQKGDRSDNAMNAATLDKFCKTKGSVKKRLQDQSLSELKKTVRQFEAINKKYQNKQKDKEYLTKLEATMEWLISKEEYEKAIVIRDEINQLKPKKKSRIKV